jgi:hypothetical protein
VDLAEPLPPDDAPNPAHVIEVGELRFAWPQVRAVATDLLATLHTLHRDKPGVRLMAAATGIDLRDRLAYYEEQVQVMPKA